MHEVKQIKNEWTIKTNNNNEFVAPNVIIAGGVGSFEPRKLPLKEAEKFENESVFYSVKNKNEFKNKKYYNFWWRDSAWTGH